MEGSEAETKPPRAGAGRHTPSPESTLGRAGPWQALGLVFCFAVLVGLLAMHVALLPSGRWFDEYFTFGFFRVWGLGGLMFRLRHWSMRPVSDAMVYGYWLLVQAAGRPLVTPVLAVAWGLLAAMLAACIRPWRRPGRIARWALLLGLPLLFLLATPVEEMWYWPLGAFAYLPALGGVCFAVLAVAGPGLRRDRDWIALAASLTLAAFSAELGAFFAVILCPLLFVDGFRRGAPVRCMFMIAVPLLAAGFVMICLLTGRATIPVDTAVPGPLLRHAMASLMAAVPTVLGGIAGTSDDVGATLRGVAARVLLGLGAWAALRQAWPAPVSRWPVAAVGVAMAGASLLSIAGAYFQFGALCCPRHESFRQAMDLLMVVLVAGVLPRGGVWRGWTRVVLAPPALLVAAALVGAPPRVVALLAEYRVAPAQSRAKAAMWRSGQDHTSPTLEVVQVTDGPLLAGYPFTPGVYGLSQKLPWYVQGPMLFFGKTRLVVTKGQ